MLYAYARMRRHERDPPDASDRSGQGETGNGTSPGSLCAVGREPIPLYRMRTRSFATRLRGGAVSIGEMKFHVALDSPEMRRVYDIAAEMGVPVMMHIQTFPHFPGEIALQHRLPSSSTRFFEPTRGRRSSGTATSSGPTSAPMFRPIAAIPPGRSSLVASRIGGCPTSRTSMRTCRPIPGTTRCRATQLSRATSSCGTRESCSSAVIAVVQTARDRVFLRTTTPRQRDWPASASHAKPSAC